MRTCRRFPNVKKRRKQNIITTGLCEGLDKEVYTLRRSARSHAVYTFVPLSLFQEANIFCVLHLPDHHPGLRKACFVWMSTVCASSVLGLAGAEEGLGQVEDLPSFLQRQKEEKTKHYYNRVV